MKSITKKITLLLALSGVLFLSSCLDSGSPHYIGNDEISYIAIGETTGIVYARTLAGFAITSPKIKQLMPGSMARISYQVKTEEDQTVMVDENQFAYVVELASEPSVMQQTTLELSLAPNVPAVKFESLMDPLFAQNDYFGDRWIFPYTYKAKKGENVKVRFYKASDEDAKTASTDVLIDLRLEKSGTAEGDATDKTQGDNIVVNMSMLRSMMADKANSEGKINIKFRYHRSDVEDIYTNNQAYSMYIGIK